MTVALANVGDYRGAWVDYALIEKKTAEGAFNGLTLHVKIRADEVWMIAEGTNDPSWLDCLAWDCHGEGYIVLVSKAGKVNESQIQSLIKCAGWNGDFQTLADHTWEPKAVRFDIAESSYNNQTSYRINWINDFDSEPGGGGNVDADRAKALNNQFGSVVRALRGNLQQKPAPAAGKPAAPNAPNAPNKSNLRKTEPKSQAQAHAKASAPSDAEPADEIPF